MIVTLNNGSRAIVSASTPRIQGASVAGGPCQVLEHSSCLASAFPPYQGGAVVAAACQKLPWESAQTCSYQAEMIEEGWDEFLMRRERNCCIKGL